MIDRVVVNGALGFAVYQQGKLVTIVSVTVAPGRVTRLDLIRAPGSLPRLVKVRSSLGVPRGAAGRVHFPARSVAVPPRARLSPPGPSSADEVNAGEGR